jgi:hypothetical protein
MNNSNISTFSYSDSVKVDFTSDAWFNATAVAKQFNKRPNDWLSLESTKEYVKCLHKALFPEIALPEKMVTEQNQLVRTKTGGIPGQQGSWFHPKLAVAFARWLSVDFAIWCDLQIEKILRKPETKYALHDQLEIPDMPKPFATPLHPTMMTRKMKTHVQHMIDVSTYGTNVTNNKVSMDLAAYFCCDSWELIPMSHYYDVCAYFNVAPRYKADIKKNWVMVEMSSLEHESRVDLTVKLDAAQKEMQQIKRQLDVKLKASDLSPVQAAIMKIADALDELSSFAV